MLDRAMSQFQLQIAPKPPVAAMLCGRPVGDAVTLLPRLFNLCRVAQDIAVRMVFDQPLAPTWRADLADDIARDHLLKLGVLLPRALDLPARITPRDNLADMAQALMGRLPETGPGFQGYIGGDTPLAEMLRAVDRAFEAHEACAGDTLPIVLPHGFGPDLAENTVAQRHCDHPVMRDLEHRRGRGPMWRIMARALDIQACLARRLPDPQMGAGVVMVPAARGAYIIAARQENGVVSDFARTTPTDHLLMPQGVLEHSLGSLPAQKHDLARLVVDILDPCVPVTLTPGPKEESANA